MKKKIFSYFLLVLCTLFTPGISLSADESLSSEFLYEDTPLIRDHLGLDPASPPGLSGSRVGEDSSESCPACNEENPSPHPHADRDRFFKREIVSTDFVENCSTCGKAGCSCPKEAELPPMLEPRSMFPRRSVYED